MQHSDDTTRAVARLPGLEIEIEHRKLPQAERISIHVEATPSFEAFGRMMESANPFAFWAQAAQIMTQMMWLSPWLGATHAVAPGETPRAVPKA